MSSYVATPRSGWQPCLAAIARASSMSSTEKATRCMPISLGRVGFVSIASGWMYSKSSRRPLPSGVSSMAILAWFPSRPTAVSVHSPLTVSRPRTLRPRSVKKEIAASRSRTAMPTFSSLMFTRCILPRVAHEGPGREVGRDLRALDRAARHRLGERDARFGRAEGTGEVLRLVRDGAVGELHHRNRIARRTVVGDDDFAHPEVTAADDPQHAEPPIGRMAAPLRRDGRPAAVTLTRLRIVEDRVLRIDRVLDVGVAGFRCPPVFF